MILDYQTIINKIVSSSGLSKQDIEEKIQKKLVDLQDLISREGAAHIIANELNVKLFDSLNQNLKINMVQPGLSSVNILGKVIAVDNVRSYQKNNKQGRIGSFTIADETGSIRVVVWDENLINLIKDINEGSIIRLSNAYVKQNNAFKELHLGNRGQLLINPENETIGDVRITVISKRKKINELNDNESAELCGTVVQVFEPRYYNSCPICNKKVLPQSEVFSCAEHGHVTPKQAMILNIFFDDGTANIRAVLFRENAEKLAAQKKTLEEIKKEILGKQLLLRGRVNRNEMFNRIEITVNSFEEAHPEELLSELES